MSGLFRSLNIGSQSLYVSRQGIDTTSHNIANAQTEGYSRQRLDLQQRDPIAKHGVLLGSGVFVRSVDRIHDKFLQDQLNSANTDAGNSEARSDALARIEAIFSPELNSSIATELNKFFSSWQNLSKYPEELTVRTQVREQGKNLAEAFRRIDLDLRRQRKGINEYIEKSAEDVSHKLTTIAKLNDRIREMEVGGKNDSNDLRDQRDRLIQGLSEVVNINYYEDQDGMITIHGPSDVLFVDRGRAAKVEVQQNGQNEGLFDVIIVDSEDSTSRNVTDHIKGGKLAGLLHVRDTVARQLIDHNNNMVVSLVDQFNAIHKQGFGIEQFREVNGRGFFADVKDQDFAAQNMKIDISIANSTDAISTSSLMNSVGDNVIANKLARLQTQKIISNGDESQASTLNDYYADYIGILGMESLKVKQIQEADNIILADLKSRRESISGVSLDEEATNLIRWQTAFTASSKVITTIDEMLETVLSLKRS